MCIFPKPPEIKPLPVTPTVDDDSVRQREELERQRLAASSGTTGTVKTDLAPAAVSGGQKRITLGS